MHEYVASNGLSMDITKQIYVYIYINILIHTHTYIYIISNSGTMKKHEEYILPPKYVLLIYGSSKVREYVRTSAFFIYIIHYL